MLIRSPVLFDARTWSLRALMRRAPSVASANGWVGMVAFRAVAWTVATARLKRDANAIGDSLKFGDQRSHAARESGVQTDPSRGVVPVSHRLEAAVGSRPWIAGGLCTSSICG